MTQQIAEQIRSVGLDAFPCRADKSPAVAKGQSWKVVAKQPADSFFWQPDSLVGLPIPPGTVVLDLDTYKGVTREAVDEWLGVRLDWDAALIQHTAGGGQHYAFAVDWPVQFGSSLGGDLVAAGLDTRTAGQGYIATGQGYGWQGFGPLRLAQPATLPRLPDATRPYLEKQVNAVPSTVKLPEGDRDVDTIRDALRHISADCTRAEWVNVGMALKHHFHDDEETGYALFVEWSESAPDRLDYDSLSPQWNSFKIDNGEGGTVTAGTLMYLAMQSGYVPPRGFDTLAAFSGGATIEAFGDIVSQITAEGCDATHAPGLVSAIDTFNGSEIQRTVLRSLLHRELKDAGLLTRELRAMLDGKSAATTPSRNAPGAYGKNHTENAQLFLQQFYPSGLLVRSDECWYAYDGKCWQDMDDDHVKHLVFQAMRDSLPQDSTINGAYNVLSKMCYTSIKIGRTPSHLVIYQNGVLDITTGVLQAHTPDIFTTVIMPYDYTPGRSCNTWLAFLDEVFEGDQERVHMLQEWFGYMLTSSYYYQKLMLLVGPSRSGKGTIGKMLRLLVGDGNFSGGSLQSFSSDKFIDTMRHRSVMFVGDAEQRVPRSVVGTIIERLKTITGNDAISFDRLYKNSLTETLPTRITIASNHIPSLFDDSGALANRFLVLPINVSFADKENPVLFDHLREEIEGVGAWALEGLHRLNQAGKFTMPQASLDESEYVRETYSPLTVFISDVCAPYARQFTTSVEVFEAYRAWAVRTGEANILAQRTFIGAFKDATRGRFQYGKHYEGRGFKGLKLRAVEGGTHAEAFMEVVK